MRKNAPELWNNVWQRPVSWEEDIYTHVKRENSVRWQRIEQIVLSMFNTFAKLQVIEIGAGSGGYAALMAKRGAQVTILDYSEKALQRSHEFFKRNGLTAEFVEQDALNLPPDLSGRYDISMSFGLAEHFRGDDRIKIIRSHFDLLNNGGIAFISVPNKYNLPYRLFKLFAERTGHWYVGEEYPFSRGELKKICRQLNISTFSFWGDSVYSSFNFISRLKILTKDYLLETMLTRFPRLSRPVLNCTRAIKNRTFTRRNKTFDIGSIKKEKGTILDQYLGYGLVLCARKAPAHPAA